MNAPGLAKTGVRMWAAVVPVAITLAMGFTTWRSQPSAIETPSPSPNRFLPTVESKGSAPGAAPDGMVWIPGGEFSMGAQMPPDPHDAVGMQATTDSRPVHRVAVDGFWMDATEVTNEQFARFVKATGYVTVAEQIPRAEDFPGAPASTLVPGSVIFSPPHHPVPLADPYQWWADVNGASWRHPLGPKSSIAGQGALSGGAHRLRRRGCLREMGRQAVADRGGMGVCGARRPDRPAFSLGR